MVSLTLFRTKFRVRILYKSGNSHCFWCTQFGIKALVGGGKTYEWTSVTQSNTPIHMGVDEIEAVWQVGGKLNVFTAIKQVIESIFGASK